MVENTHSTQSSTYFHRHLFGIINQVFLALSWYYLCVFRLLYTLILTSCLLHRLIMEVNKHIKTAMWVVLNIVIITCFIAPDYAAENLRNLSQGFQSYTGGNFSRVHDSEGSSTDPTLLKNAEAVIRLFERQPAQRSNTTALADYVKALVKVHRLEEGELLNALQRGNDHVLQYIECSALY